MPSRKWFATQVTALTALATMYVTTNSWDQEETIALIGIVSQAALAYLVPNDPNAERSSWGARDQRGATEPLTLLVYVIVIVILIAVLFAVLDRI